MVTPYKEVLKDTVQPCFGLYRVFFFRRWSGNPAGSHRFPFLLGCQPFYDAKDGDIYFNFTAVKGAGYDVCFDRVPGRGLPRQLRKE